VCARGLLKTKEKRKENIPTPAFINAPRKEKKSIVSRFILLEKPAGLKKSDINYDNFLL